MINLSTKERKNMENKQINLDNDYTKKVQAGILLPKKQHENFEMIKSMLQDMKSEQDELKNLVMKFLDNK
jgi:hypothetical protein